MNDDEILVIVAIATAIPGLISASQLLLDGRTMRAPISDHPTVHHDFYPNMKALRSPHRYKQTLRMEPDTFDHILAIIKPRYIQMFGEPRPNAKYGIDVRLA